MGLDLWADSYNLLPHYGDGKALCDSLAPAKNLQDERFSALFSQGRVILIKNIIGWGYVRTATYIRLQHPDSSNDRNITI